MSKKNSKKREQKRQHLYRFSAEQFSWLVNLKFKESESEGNELTFVQFIEVSDPIA